METNIDSPIVHFKIAYLPEDMKQTMRLHLKSVRNKLALIFIPIGIILILFGVLTMLFLENSSTPYILIIVGILYLLFVAVRPKLVAASYAKKHVIKGDIEYHIAKDQIISKGWHFKSEIGWKFYEKAVISNNYILLYPSPLVFHIIPKRVMSDGDYMLCIDYVKANIEEVKTVK